MLIAVIPTEQFAILEQEQWWSHALGLGGAVVALILSVPHVSVRRWQLAVGAIFLAIVGATWLGVDLAFG